MGEAVDVLEWHIGNSLCRRGNVWFVCEQEKSRKTKATHKEIMLEFLPFYSVHAIHICRWWRQKISFNTIANSWAGYKVEKYSLKAKRKNIILNLECPASNIFCRIRIRWNQIFYVKLYFKLYISSLRYSNQDFMLLDGTWNTFLLYQNID